VITGAEGIEWDLSDLYSSPTDPAFLSDLDGIITRCHDFHDAWKGALATLDAVDFAQALQEYEALSESMDRMASYSQLIWSTDTEDPRNGQLLQTVRERVTAASHYLIFFSIEVCNLSSDKVEDLCINPYVASRRHWIETVIDYKPHVLSEEVEQVLTEKSLSSRMAWVRLHDVVSNAQVFELNGHVYTESQILKLLHEPDRATRKAAAASISAGLATSVRTQAYIFNTVIADHASNDRLRGYKTWLSSRNQTNEATDEGVAALIDSVVSRYGLVRRFYALKQRLLGYSELFDYDRYAPVGEDHAFWSWNQAREIVLNAYHKFHPVAGEIASMFFEKNWIHAPARKGKNGGAYSAGTIASAHPYVFLNYMGTNRDVQTLAHELGHGIHQYLSRKQGPLLMDTPLTVAETASVFGEIITFNSLFDVVTERKQRLSMLVNKLDDIISTVFRQIALNRFEESIHLARRAEGELTVQRMSDLWIETQSAQFGDAVVLSDGYEYYWSYISHFMHAPGYVYAYAYGELLVLSLHEIYKKDKAAFPDKYLELLSSGGSKKPNDLLAPFNINEEDPAFWNVGLDVIERVLTEAERLAEE
jgi:oligoendopeptidase F